MSDWETVVEDGVTYHVHAKYGNIVQLSEDCCFVLVPKVIKIGEFDSLESAKIFMGNCQDSVSELTEDLAEQLMQDYKLKLHAHKG